RLGLYCCEFACPAGCNVGHRKVGIYDLSRGILASGDLAVSRRGLPAISPQPCRPSLRKSSVARDECGTSVSLAARRNRIDPGQLCGRRPICLAPGECRVGCLGRRAQERAKHAFLLARHACLYPVCAYGPKSFVFCSSHFVCAGPDGEAADCHSAFCAVALGLLASSANEDGIGSRRLSEGLCSALVPLSDSGKGSSVPPGRGRFTRDRDGTARRARGAERGGGLMGGAS